MKRLSCICIPDKESNDKIGKLMLFISKRANSKNALNFKPHFTIRGDFQVREADVGDLIEDLTKVCLETKKIKLKLSKYGFYQWKIIYLDIEKTDVLQNLHNRCMDVINKYRTNWIPDALRNNKSYKGKQLKYIRKYGYHFAYEFYSPHFTLAGNDIEVEVFKKLTKQLENRKEDITCTARYLSLVDREDNNKLIVKIKLGD